MKTSIVILTHNQLEVTKLCIDSIRNYTSPGSYELIVVDNASSDGTVGWLQEQKDIKTIYNHQNLGFPKGCNQGMEIATGDNILLLNNDTIVTYNWLDNLLACLYSSEDIGAVGPVTNHCAYYQIIPVNYQTIEEMHKFAKQYNIQEPSKWEERLKLIGFALLIKREVVSKVGYFDEMFTPGNFEDDDYSTRVRQEGYKLILCKDTFIHHFGSMSFKEKPKEYNNLLIDNEKKFIQKWGFNSSRSTVIRFEVVELIDANKDDEISVLEIGCGCGGTLLQVKNKFKNARLFGMDENINAVKQAESFAEIKVGKIDGDECTYSEGFFDYIILSNELERSSKPGEVIKKIAQYLKPDGVLIASIKNFAHVHVIKKLIQGESFLGEGEIRYFTLSEIIDVFKREGFGTLELSGMPANTNNDDRNFISQLCSISSAEMEKQYKTIQYVVKAKLTNNESIKETVKLIEQNIDVKHNLAQLNQMKLQNVIESILQMEQPVQLLNIIAAKNFENGNYESVIPYLHKAFELDNHDADTLYNLAYVLNFIGEKELADKYAAILDKLNGEEVAVSNQTDKEELLTKQNLKYFIRRLEYNIDLLESKRQILYALSNGSISSEDIIETINKDIISKVSMFNLIAVSCYENGLFEQVIPYLQASLLLDEANPDTLFNLGFILSQFGEKELALSFLEKIVMKDEAVMALISDIKGVQNYE